jgi:hypothetical protein
VEALGACVRSLDAKLAAGWGDPPLLSEMVDETLVSMVTQRQSMGADQSDIGSLRHVVTLPPSGATT